MGSGYSKMKKQAKMLQDQMSKIKDDMQNIEKIGSAGGTLVQITLNGEKEITKIKISPDCVDKDDVEGLEDLILAAYKDASQQVDKECPMPNSSLPFNLGM